MSQELPDAKNIAAEFSHRAPPGGRSETSKKPRVLLRKIWLNVHLSIGLIAGAVFVLIGLTGSILAFREEIDAWLNADLQTVALPVEGTATYRPLDEILAAAKAATPLDGKAIFVHFPKGAAGAFDLIYSKQTAHGHREIHQIFVNPYTAEVAGQRLIASMESHFSEPFIMLIMHMHYTLLLGEPGETFVGFIGLFLFASLTTGLYLWWPRNGKWRQAFTIKRGASIERTILDLHKTTGLYACSVLVVILFSGTYLIFGPQVRALVALVSPVRQNMMPEELKSEPTAGRPPIGEGSAATIADRAFPDGALMSLQLPAGPDGVYVIGKHSQDEVNKTETKRLVAVDQHSGKILHIQDPKNFTAGEKFLEWQFPLHTGEAFGNVGRAFIMLMGFVPLTLYVTGVTRWLQKRRARRV